MKSLDPGQGVWTFIDNRESSKIIEQGKALGTVFI